jgi:hypothetical protein
MDQPSASHQLPEQNVSEDEDLMDQEIHQDDDSYGSALAGMDAIEAQFNMPKSTTGFQLPSNSGPIANRKKGPAQTGPKGVKADYEAEKLRLKAIRINEAIKRERLLNQMAVGDPVFNAPQQNILKKKIEDEDEDEEFDEEDDAIFMEYKMQQIQKLKNNM